MPQNNIEIQSSVAVQLVPVGTAEELGCTTARYDVSVTIAASEKRIGYLTVAPKPVFGGGTSCFFAELSDEDGNLGNASVLEAEDITEAAIAMLSFKLFD
ncbi:MAG: hypothetical protein Q4F75_01205 [Pseudomonadota bacterium]|nr:hypothetical protein [Pseudomonadota bacterium]